MEITREYRDMIGYEDLFSISNDGLLFSKRTNKELKQNLVGKGYLAHATKIGGRTGKNLLIKIHREVAKAFVCNPDDFPEVNHIDGNKLNNVYTNLEWVTTSENIQHAWDNGLRDKAACGTTTMYRNGCRCEKCLQAIRIYKNSRVAQR